jgi:2-polyprenyl-3-methyl-5-hydroxy-6-metoxy-1,4-benzoquinol methylase
MDDPSLDEGEHAAALRGLRRVHAISGTSRRMWRPIQRLITTYELSELSILDVGCGDGALLRHLWKVARRSGCSLQLHGCDFSLRALDMCTAACKQAGVPISLYHVDVLRQPLPKPVDVVINSLFLHHFGNDQIAPLLSQMATRSRYLLLVEDLLRGRLSYIMVWLGVRLLTRCRVVHVDGPLSVKAAFTQQEMRRLLDQAKLTTARLEKRWPERMFITWEVPAEQTTEVKTLGCVTHAR